MSWKTNCYLYRIYFLPYTIYKIKRTKVLKKLFHYSKIILVTIVITTITTSAKEKTESKDTLVNSSLVSGLKFRSIGPALTPGRIPKFE